MKDSFYIVIETMHYADQGVSENVLFLQIFTEKMMINPNFYLCRFMSCLPIS